MRRIAYKPYLFLIIALLSMMSIPQTATEKLRSATICCLSPTWSGLNFLKNGLINLLIISTPGMEIKGAALSLETDGLRQENQILHSQIESMREWLLFEDRIEEQLERFKSISLHEEGDLFWKDFFRRRSEQLCQSLDLQLQSLPAKVIFREPASWSSTLWLNVGEKENEALGRTVVAKNSPVLVGTSIVGVVEYVGARQCRVRLITDSGLVPSVRAIRGKQQNQFLKEHLDAILFALEGRDDLFVSKEEESVVFQALGFLKNNLNRTSRDHYMAKGELYGSSSPLWRSRSQLLKGVGFNYDYHDEEGPARDLRTGESIDGSKKTDMVPLLKPGDLLVTTGLDGVFPPGFRVAIVTKVHCLREGSCAYELDAQTTAGNLDELNYVCVLPPMDFERS